MHSVPLKMHVETFKKASRDMFSNPEQLKNKLEEAVTVYLKEIENKWFRNDGRMTKLCFVLLVLIV
jgi:hypothetical protein